MSAWADKCAKQNQMLRDANSARSIQSITQQASAYIPVSSPPQSLPRYLSLDVESEWSNAALLCTAVETVTLPSRLTNHGGRKGSLTALEAILNSNGRQNIFDLSSTSRTMTSPSQNGRMIEGTGLHDSVATTMTLDIEYTPISGRQSLGKTPHIFRQIDIQRCLSLDEVLVNHVAENAAVEARVQSDSDTRTEV